MVGLAVSLAISASAMAAGDRAVRRAMLEQVWGGTPVWQLAHGWPGLPPPITPAVLAKFIELLASYRLTSHDTPISFAQWIALNGVTDPRECACLLWLYWQSMHRAEVG
jgi:hypothetical protein